MSTSRQAATGRDGRKRRARRHPPKGCGQLELAYLYGGIVQYKPGEALGPRQLTDYELVLILEGSVTYLSCCREHVVPPGGIVLAQPGEHEGYRWDPRRRTRHAYFHFDIESVPGDWPPHDDWAVTLPKPPRVVSELFHHVLQHAFAHPEWPATRPDRQECRLVETLISEILTCGTHRLHREPERDRAEPVKRAIKWMRELIDEDAERTVTLDDVAHQSGVTKKHLCRLFAQNLGHSPMATLRLLRLQLGLALLSRSNLSVREVAERCGFENAFYFSRCFTKTFGAAPSRVREALRAGATPPRTPLPADIMPRVYW